MSLYSKDYQEYLARKSMIADWVSEAKGRAKGSRLYGKEVDINNLDELLAMYYILSNDMGLFHEPYHQSIPSSVHLY